MRTLIGCMSSCQSRDGVAVDEVVTKVAVLEERMENLEQRLNDHERRQNASMDKIETALKEINQKIDGRPSWAVTFLLTGLSSLVVGLIVAALKGG